MSKGYITYRPEGRLGNALFQAAAAMAYAWDHGMEFSMPTMSRDDKWAPVYCQHLAKPDFDPAREKFKITEIGYAHRELPWMGSIRTEGRNVELVGFFQSPKYFARHHERILEAFAFPWRPMAGQWCAVHIRRGDAVRYPEKHLLQSREWIEAQMAKFPGHNFRFFSDDYAWCRSKFGHRKDCFFDDFPRVMSVDDDRPEVQDLVDASCCQHLIGSSSTFAIWIALLNRNPGARRIFPKQWLVEGWEGTTAATWKDVMPHEWERA